MSQGQKTVDMTDMIVCNEEIRLLFSKPQSQRALHIPEFGQEIVLTEAVEASAPLIKVEPLVENLKVGSVLNFKDKDGNDLGSVTSNIPAKKGVTEIFINAAAAAIANYASATTDAIEQTLTLANAVAVDDRVITLASPLTDWIEKGRVLTFNNGVSLVAKNRVEAGSDTISIVPAKYTVNAGEVLALPNYLEVCSLNQLDDSSAPATINERNFKSGVGTGKAVTSYNDTISLSGNYIINDFALHRLWNIKGDQLLRGHIVYALIVEPDGGENQFAKVHLGQHARQRPNDQTKKISLTLEVDGVIETVEVVRELFDEW